MPTELQRVVSLHLTAASCFSARTRRRLERALGRTAVVPTGTRDALRHAVGAAVAELLAGGASPETVESTLRDVVAGFGDEPAAPATTKATASSAKGAKQDDDAAK